MKQNTLLIAFMLLSLAAIAEEPPMIPIGLDAYRMWDRWPYQRIGERAYMRRTYDRRSFQMAYSRTHYGTGYYIYHQFVPETKLSRPIRSWNDKISPEREVLELINRAGSGLVPKPDTAEGRSLRIKCEEGTVQISSNRLTTIVYEARTPRMIRALEFSIPREKAMEFGRARIRITWDGLPYPSVDAPIDLFFGTGNGGR